MRSLGCLSIVLLATLACGDDGGNGSVQADASEASSDDAGATIDAGDAEIPTSCEGSCQVNTLVVESGDLRKELKASYFGLTSPGRAESGNWEIWIENNAEDEGCPTEKAPMPKYIFTIDGLTPAEISRDAYTGAATLIDFEGELLSEVPVKAAESTSITWVASDICIACSEGSEDDRDSRMLALDVDASFDDGKTITGHLYATHCDSLDTLDGAME